MVQINTACTVHSAQQQKQKNKWNKMDVMNQLGLPKTTTSTASSNKWLNRKPRSGIKSKLDGNKQIEGWKWIFCFQISSILNFLAASKRYKNKPIIFWFFFSPWNPGIRMTMVNFILISLYFTIHVQWIWQSECIFISGKINATRNMKIHIFAEISTA